MTCERCEREFEGIRCSCGWNAPGFKPPSAWVIQHCSRPGCNAAIRTKIGGTEINPTCKWCLVKEENKHE